MISLQTRRRAAHTRKKKTLPQFTMLSSERFSTIESKTLLSVDLECQTNSSSSMNSRELGLLKWIRRLLKDRRNSKRNTRLLKKQEKRQRRMHSLERNILGII